MLAPQRMLMEVYNWEDVMTTVEEIMTTDLVTLTASDSIETARQLMAARHIRHIPIVDADHVLIGLVTHRDVLAASLSQLDPVEDAHRTAFEAATPLRDIMTTELDVVSEKMNLREAALRLQAHKYGCLPVVSQGKLKGIITDSDFVAVAINLLEQLELIEPLAETSDEEDF
jgi:CBS domain-containing protein